MDDARDLDWPDCYNVRDLGGLSTIDGRTTRRGAVVRADSADRLTAEGWAALWSHGVRTVLDLRNDAEREEGSPRPSGLTTVHVPPDDHSDTEFWDQWGHGLDCTPLYYRAFLRRFPATVARVVSAVADARPGGVLIHCSGGRDRTGLVAMLLLAFAGVPARDIADDYTRSARRLAPAWNDLGLGDQNGKVEALVASRGTTVEGALLDTLASVDVAAFLERAGVARQRLSALRGRLLDPGRGDNGPGALCTG